LCHSTCHSNENWYDIDVTSDRSGSDSPRGERARTIGGWHPRQRVVLSAQVVGGDAPPLECAR